MTKIKLCGLTRLCDIEAANRVEPEFVGFVFSKNSRRYVSPETAVALKSKLKPSILAVGVFVNEPIENVCEFIRQGMIDIAQLHGDEDEEYIDRLREAVERPVIKAFKIKADGETEAIEKCGADFVLLDSGAGTGNTFDWGLIRKINRPYFLAGGLNLSNVKDAVDMLRPYAVDVSSGIERGGVKDEALMKEFVRCVRKDDV